MQRRNEPPRIALAQRLGADILDQQELEPVEKLRGRRLLLHPRNLADFVEQLERLGYQALLDAGEMHLHDRAHALSVAESGCNGRSSGAGTRRAIPSRYWK